MKAMDRDTLSRFVLTGLINTAFGYVVFAGLNALGWPDVLSVPVAMLTGATFNFFTYGRLVFQRLDVRRAPQFAIAYLSVYVFNIFGLRTLEGFGLSAYSAQGLLVVPLATFTYVLSAYWVFRES